MRRGILSEFMLRVARKLKNVLGWRKIEETRRESWGGLDQPRLLVEDVESGRKAGMQGVPGI